MSIEVCETRALTLKLYLPKHNICEI